MKHDFDMVAIGGGAAGLTAAGMSAVLGAKTALVSSGRLGGECTWSGCVPSKTLLHASKAAHTMRAASDYGLMPVAVSHDWQRITRRLDAVRQHIYEGADAPPNMERLGVEIIGGQARFLDRNTLEVVAPGQPKRRVTSRYFIIATGSSPVLPEIQGLNPGSLITNESLFELPEQPRRLLILGAGPVGVEMAQAFQRLGSSVTLVDRSARILGRDDAELSEVLAGCLRKEGVQLLLGQELASVGQGTACLKNGEAIAFDAILAATGRRPNLESLHLSSAGIPFAGQGIQVDRRCRTAAKNIFACGDVLSKNLFTHMAEHTAKVAVTNAILRVPAKVDEGRVPWCTFTDPELAHVGMGEAELKKRGLKFQVYRFPFSKLDRAITESEPVGMVKVFAGSRGRVLGASILGKNAGEMIAEYALAMRAKVGLGRISSTIHPYPTYSLGNRRAADFYVTDRLTPFRVRWLQWLFGLRGDTRGIMNLKGDR